MSEGKEEVGDEVDTNYLPPPLTHPLEGLHSFKLLYFGTICYATVGTQTLPQSLRSIVTRGRK